MEDKAVAAAAAASARSSCMAGDFLQKPGIPKIFQALTFELFVFRSISQMKRLIRGWRMVLRGRLVLGGGV
jgi:hypothetical protein